MLSLKEKVKILLTLSFGLDEKFTINQINDLESGRWDYEIHVSFQNAKAKYGIKVQYEQFVCLYLLEDNNRLNLICSTILN